MPDHTTSAILTSMLLAGLAGSLHCIGMCGPILLGFSQAFAGDDPARRRPLWLDFAGYHAGRIWTYTLMGFAAGLVSEQLRHGSAALGWQSGISIALSAAVILSGVALLGVIPGLKLDRVVQCGMQRFGAAGWFQRLIEQRGLWPRVLLGLIMGFLPCGLVYAMLVAAAALPTPLHSALGMFVFGIGTLPSLSLVIGAAAWLQRVVGPRWRAQGGRLAAVLLILTGGWMLARTVLPHDHSSHAGHTDHAESPATMQHDDHQHHH